jgi:hypothetical protein
MPLVDGKLMTPDDAIAADRCPECGRDLKTTNPIAERNSHWRVRPNNDADGIEGLRRMKMLDDYIAKNDVHTSDFVPPEAPKPNAAPEV